MYNDSHQYVAMHIHREPGYSFFLWIFRTLFGENVYLEIVRFLQNLLAAYSVLIMTSCIRRNFELGRLMTFLISLILLAPHLITPLFSATALVLSNGVVSEALVLPMFYLFMAACIEMLLKRKKRAVVISLLLALLLSLTRGQMMASVLLWFAVFLASALESVLEKAKACRKQAVLSFGKKLLLAALAVMLAFGARTVVVKSYNLAFNGHFINNTYGNINLLANIMYAADREDGELIEDEKAREFFEISYELLEEKQANYKYSPEGFLNRAAHLEQWHDEIKFNMIEQPWRDWHDAAGFTEYIPENIEQDRIAGIIMKSILPEVLGEWLYGYLAFSSYGLIRSVSVVHPLFNWFAFFVYAGGIGLTIFTFIKHKSSKAARIAALAFLTVAANVYSTSLVIMCLSRYMIYSLPFVYIGGLLLLYENVGFYRKKK